MRATCPLWLSPQQAVVCSIVSDYTLGVQTELVKVGLRSELNLRNEKINYKAASTRSPRSRSSSPSANATGYLRCWSKLKPVIRHRLNERTYV
jgi:hypothetical protein